MADKYKITSKSYDFLASLRIGEATTVSQMSKITGFPHYTILNLIETLRMYEPLNLRFVLMPIKRRKNGKRIEDTKVIIMRTEPIIQKLNEIERKLGDIEKRLR